jgi:DNA helicase-4
MPATRWGPTRLGRLFTGSRAWRLDVDDEHYYLSIDGHERVGDILELKDVRFTYGVFWTSIRLTDPFAKDRVLLGLDVDGIPNQKADELEKLLARAAKRRDLALAFQNLVGPALSWVSQADGEISKKIQKGHWITSELVRALIQSKPRGLDELLATPGISQHIESQPAPVREGMKRLRRDLSAVAQEANEKLLADHLTRYKDFFVRVEKSPLTQEQAKAVVCFDNRLLLVASAGSGKTSTMVAKAGYALKNGYCEADRMLLLAFNTSAAAELRERLKHRLTPLGLPAEQIVAKTFHAFGLEVIGLATGKRPSLAPWVESGRDLEFLLGLIDSIKDRDPAFRFKWDLFRIVFGQDLPKFGEETQSPDSWDSATKTRGFTTLNGEIVKSRGEKIIADWLFYNGISYVYEGPYEVDTADERHRQYVPDFYLPDAKAYLEHWGVDANGEPPPEFVGYKDGMAWKRQTHAENGTTLLETTMADLWSGKAFSYLEAELEKRGIKLDPNPDRPIPGRTPIENPRLARTFRSFMTHAKSNRLTARDWNARLDQGVATGFKFRHKFFLELMEAIWNEWEAQLKAAGAIDFEDMLNLATDCIEKGTWESPFDVVMVDEFQDASNARARLVAALVRGPNKHLFAVGDDWQSINRFAGADLSVMTDFERLFGKAVTLKLETTFRCPQSLCDISSKFVQRNPKQLRKRVRSFKSGRDAEEDPVRIVRLDSQHHMASAVARRVSQIGRGAKGQRPKVFVLGRYQKDRAFLPGAHEHLDLEFVTVHGSKGLEAEHIIIPGMTSETLGFPSRVADDPVLLLAMPGGDDFVDAEERRLFYVALTRARSTVTLMTVANKESDFIKELIREHAIPCVAADGSESASSLCPKCGNGFLLQRKSQYGAFWGCSAFPSCNHTANIPSVQKLPNRRPPRD